MGMRLKRKTKIFVAIPSFGLRNIKAGMGQMTNAWRTANYGAFKAGMGTFAKGGLKLAGTAALGTAAIGGLGAIGLHKLSSDG